MTEKTGNVIPFPHARRAAPRFRRSGVIADSASKPVDRKGCINLLNGISPMPDSLVELLAVPENLFLRGDEPSFSSDTSLGIGRVAASLGFNTPMPKDIPDYGILISSRGSNVFCTLVDRRRKIIVMESIGNVYGGGNTWDNFLRSLGDALAVASRTDAAGKRFDFIVNAEGSIRAIRI